MSTQTDPFSDGQGVRVDKKSYKVGDDNIPTNLEDVLKSLDEMGVPEVTDDNYEEFMINTKPKKDVAEPTRYMMPRGKIKQQNEYISLHNKYKARVRRIDMSPQGDDIFRNGITVYSRNVPKLSTDLYTIEPVNEAKRFPAPGILVQDDLGNVGPMPTFIDRTETNYIYESEDYNLADIYGDIIEEYYSTTDYLEVLKTSMEYNDILEDVFMNVPHLVHLGVQNGIPVYYHRLLNTYMTIVKSNMSYMKIKVPTNDLIAIPLKEDMALAVNSMLTYNQVISNYSDNIFSKRENIKYIDIDKLKVYLGRKWDTYVYDDTIRQNEEEQQAVSNKVIDIEEAIEDNPSIKIQERVASRDYDYACYSVPNFEDILLGRTRYATLAKRLKGENISRDLTVRKRGVLTNFYIRDGLTLESIDTNSYKFDTNKKLYDDIVNLLGVDPLLHWIFRVEISEGVTMRIYYDYVSSSKEVATVDGIKYFRIKGGSVLPSTTNPSIYMEVDTTFTLKPHRIDIFNNVVPIPLKKIKGYGNRIKIVDGTTKEIKVEHTTKSKSESNSTLLFNKLVKLGYKIYESRLAAEDNKIEMLKIKNDKARVELTSYEVDSKIALQPKLQKIQEDTATNNEYKLALELEKLKAQERDRVYAEKEKWLKDREDDLVKKARERERVILEKERVKKEKREEKKRRKKEKESRYIDTMKLIGGILGAVAAVLGAVLSLTRVRI